MLGGLLFVGSAVPIARAEGWWLMWFYVLCAGLLVALELIGKPKRAGLVYYFSFMQMAFVSSLVISVWLPRQAVKLLGDERGLLTVSVLCLSAAAAIQLFVLP